MSEIAHLSLNSSSLYNSSIAGNSADLDEYIYSMPKSKCNAFLDKFHMTKINNCDWDSTCSVEIPAYGILRRAMIKLEIEWYETNATADNLSNALIARGLFARLIKRADLMNSSRVILSLHDDIIQYLMYQMEPSQSKKYLIAGLDNTLVGGGVALKGTTGGYNNVACANNGTGVAKKIVVYCPLPFSCFEMGGAGHPSKSNLDTRFLERLSVSLTMGKMNECVYFQAGTGGAVTKAPTIKNAWLMTDFDIIASKTLDSIEKANFSTSSPLAQVFSNYVKVDHPFTAGASDTLDTANFETITMNLYNTQLAHSIIVVCRKVPNDTDTQDLHDAVAKGPARKDVKGHTANVALIDEISRVGADFKTLHTIELAASGRTLYKTTTPEEGKFLTNYHGHGQCWLGHEVQNVGGNAILDGANGSVEQSTAGNFGSGLATEPAQFVDVNGCSATNFYVIPFANDSQKSNGIQGALALKNLNSLTLTVTTKCKAAKNYVLTAYVRYYQAIATESNSGRIQVSISN